MKGRAACGRRRRTHGDDFALFLVSPPQPATTPDDELAALRAALAAATQDRPFACLIAAGGDAAVVGTLDVAAVRGADGGPPSAYLANVCVSPAARRRGVAVALIGGARRVAAGWGAAALRVHAAAGDGAARALYTRAGFVVEDGGGGEGGDWVLYRDGVAPRERWRVGW